MPTLPNSGVSSALSLTAGQPNPLEQPVLPSLFASPPVAAPQQQMTVPAQASAPDYNALLQQASQRDVALQQAAAQYAPSQEYNQGMLSALAALGNVAGAATGKGAVGQPALQMAEQLRQEGRLQQESFFRRVRQEEEIIKQEKAALLKAENDGLRAQSLKPLVSRIKDPKEQAMMYAALASGKLDETQAYLQKYEEMQLLKETRQLELEQKRKLFPNQYTKSVQDVIKGNQDIRKADADYAAQTGELNSLPAKERREVMRRQGDQFTKAVEKDLPTINTFLQIDRLAGGLGTPAAEKKLSRILGLGGTINGTYSGTREDRELFAGINKMFAAAKTRDFGASLTASEKGLLDAGLGFSLGTDMFSNMYVDPATLNSMLSKMGDEISGRISLAENGLDPAAVKAFASDGKAFKSLDNFTQVRQLHRDIGGYVNTMDVPPPELKQAGVSNDEWLKLTDIQKLSLIKSSRN